MTRDHWHERLEAYLDGELDQDERTAFEEATAADAELAAAVAQRQAFREQARQALTGDLPPDLHDLARGLGRQPRRAPEPRRDRRWTMMAVAAVLALAILTPRLLRDRPGAEGPRSPITRAGNVTALRFGEQPGETVVLEAGCYDLAAGSCH